MKKKRFYVKKFISNIYEYDTVFLLEVISYIIRNGIHINKWIGKWYRSGVNKSILGYSFNNEPYHSIELPLESGKDTRNIIDYMLLNFICRKQNEDIEEYKRDILKLDKENSFILIPNPGFVNYNNIVRFSEFNGKLLNYNPHYEHCPNRKNAYIKKIKVLLGCSIEVEFDFSFKMEGYNDNLWTEKISRNKNETTADYLDRCYDLILSSIL
jgi:hypothetical protein